MDLYAEMEEDAYVNFKTLTYDGGYNPRVNNNLVAYGLWIC